MRISYFLGALALCACSSDAVVVGSDHPSSLQQGQGGMQTTDPAAQAGSDAHHEAVGAGGAAVPDGTSGTMTPVTDQPAADQPPTNGDSTTGTGTMDVPGDAGTVTDQPQDSGTPDTATGDGGAGGTAGDHPAGGEAGTSASGHDGTAATAGTGGSGAEPI